MTTADLRHRAADEVVRLHEFFDHWYTGRVDRTRDRYAAFERSLAPGFQLVAPDGALLERESLLAKVWSRHGARAGFAVWIEGVHVRELASDLVLARYQEWQREDGVVRGRVATATLAASDEGPGRMHWLHVHETWLADAA